MMKVLIISPTFTKEGESFLRRFFEVKKFSKLLVKEDLIAEIGDINGIILHPSQSFDEEVIASASELKIIASHGVGTDNIDIPEATKRGIYVTNTPSAKTEVDTVADFTLGLILACVRKITEANSSVKKGDWKGTRFIGTDLAEKKLGIIGFGAIGSKVAKRAQAFSLKVLAFDPYVSSEQQKRYDVKFVKKLESLLRQADIVSIHAPLTSQTRKMIGLEQFYAMKKGSYLINTARGAIIDENALHKVLKEKHLAGGALDVFSEEPLDPASPLLEFDNLVLTPHIAACTREALNRISITAAKDVFRSLKGKPPKFLVNPGVKT